MKKEKKNYQKIEITIYHTLQIKLSTHILLPKVIIEKNICKVYGDPPFQDDMLWKLSEDKEWEKVN